ncbi:hypothetical protein BH23ACT8_BH23ACT8_23150 [soil metagenome]|jgi:prevent-host-death family protein
MVIAARSSAARYGPGRLVVDGTDETLRRKTTFACHPTAAQADALHGLLGVCCEEAERHLSRLLRRVAAGEEIVICRSGLPIIRLVPFEQTRDRGLGRDRGLFEVTDDFDEPLPDDLVDAFEA